MSCIGAGGVMLAPMADVALDAPTTAAAPARPEFEIVPLRGLPIVAAVLVALVVAIAADRLCALASGWQLGRQLGTIDSGYANHGWIVASYVVVGVMAVIALAVLEPANVAVLFELKKRRPDPAIIQRLMRRFIYTAGITGAMQGTTLVIMTKVAVG